MRLINTASLKLHEFDPKAVPAYAILSHRWTDDEVSYKDFAKGRRQDSQGHVKIVQFCQFLRSWEREWAWVDTVCIDKRSSAELSEAINSMFKWYAEAAECYVWMQDVSAVGDVGDATAHEARLQQFTESVWFQRGWTLQELLAPAQVIFCSREWQVLGCKRAEPDPISVVLSGQDMHREGLTSPWTRLKKASFWSPDIILWAITHRSGIPSEVLLSPFLVRNFSVAQRMSWASNRQTTRIEDQAYCLLGLFGINMPLLYGEGARAFQRLQHEIIRSSHDESIYAWTSLSASPFLLNATPHFPILARSPGDFEKSGDIVRTLGIQRSPWTVTHHGLEVPLVADNQTGTIELPGFSKSSSSNYFASGPHSTVAISFPLACKREGDPDSEPCKLVIYRLDCAHWGRLCATNLKGHRPQGWTPTTIKSDRQKVYVHVDECEDLNLL